jgi:resuscitation-promoting factor RpfB
LRLTLYGKTETVYTQSATVGEFMQEKDITLGKDDDMSLPQSTAITANMQLSIWRNGKQTITQEEDVAFETQTIRDANREIGYRQVETPGKAGKKMVTYEIIMQNGKEVSRVEVQSVVTKQPIKQVETVGSKRPPVAGPAEILNKINAASARLGIDANRVATIAKCESGFNPNADSGYYKGIFQHDPNYWPARASRYGFAGASIFDVDAQIGVSTQMMAGGGWSHWGCDPGN